MITSSTRPGDCSTAPTTPKTSTHWLTAFTVEALELGVKERALSLHKKLGDVIDIKEITIPNQTTHQFVGWDGGRVSEVDKDLPLFSSEFGSCIAILARAFEDHSKKPSFTALHHVFMQPLSFNQTLKKLQEKISAGTIEIFISGGIQIESGEYLREIYSVIDKRRKKNKEITVEVCDDTFGIGDLGQPHKVVKEMCYAECVGVFHAGFNAQHAPFQVIDMTNNHPFDKATITKIFWLEGRVY